MNLGLSRQAIRSVLTSPRFVPKILPMLLLGGLLFVGIVTVVAQSGQYGIAEDELVQDPYGRAALAWYGTLGRNTSFLTMFIPEAHMPEHGAIFEVVVAAVQYALPSVDHWFLRHLVTALAGVIGIAVIALAGFELGGYWVAFLAGLGLWLYPRYYGSIYSNSKDVPAAITWTLVLWAALALVQRWNAQERPQRYLLRSALLGGCVGLATAIRVYGLLWYIILGIFLAGWWLLQGRRVWQEGHVRAELFKQGKAAALMGVTSFATMVILWPYLILNPVVNLYRAITISSHYPWNGPVLFRGTVYPATQLPIEYVGVWLIIGSTLTCIVVAALGLGVIIVSLIRRRRVDPRLSLVLLSFILPLGALVGLHAVLYGGLRQFLFLIPALILIGAYGLARAVTWLANREGIASRSVAIALIALTVVSYTLDVRDMLALSPFEYSYFSPLIGGIAGAEGKYDTDYWSTCNKQAAEWLGANYQEYTSSPAPTVEAKTVESLATVYLPAVFRDDETGPDFYISSILAGYDLRYPSYHLIHVVTADGVPVCVVKVNPSLVSRGDE